MPHPETAPIETDSPPPKRSSLPAHLQLLDPEQALDIQGVSAGHRLLAQLIPSLQGTWQLGQQRFHTHYHMQPQDHRLPSDQVIIRLNPGHGDHKYVWGFVDSPTNCLFSGDVEVGHLPGDPMQVVATGDISVAGRTFQVRLKGVVIITTGVALRLNISTRETSRQGYGYSTGSSCIMSRHTAG